PAAVGPDFRALESRLRRQVPELGYRVFVRVLGMDRFAGVEGEAVRADVHRLPGERYQVHLDAARSGVVEGIVREAPQVEVSAQPPRLPCTGSVRGREKSPTTGTISSRGNSRARRRAAACSASCEMSTAM